MKQIVVITGAGGGLGSIFATEFAKDGHDIAILDYTKSKTDDFNLLDLILQMYDCNIEDTTNTTKMFDLIDKFVPDISTNLTITFCNNKFQSISEGFIII